MKERENNLKSSTQKETVTSIDAQAEPKKVARNAAIVVVVVAVLCAVCYFAWSMFRSPDISAYADTPITVSGLGEDFTITPADLAMLECKKGSVSGEGKGADGQSKISSTEVYGPTLKTFLAKYGNGKTTSDFGRMILRSSDDYEVVVKGEAITDDIVLSIGQGSKPLDDKEMPMRFIIPSLPTGKWARCVVSITFQE